MNAARLGGPIGLLVVGAILYFAVNYDLGVVSISMIGLICMIAGALWLVIELLANGRRSSTTAEHTVHTDASGRGQVTVREVRHDL